MNRSELDKYRQRLRDLGRRLSRDDNQLQSDALRPSGASAEGSILTPPGDTGDLSNYQAQQDVSLGLLENERRMLEQIAAALQRIDQGTFGRCVECGREIAAARLEALPYTPHCIDCARKQDASGPGPMAVG